MTDPDPLAADRRSAQPIDVQWAIEVFWGEVEKRRQHLSWRLRDQDRNAVQFGLEHLLDEIEADRRSAQPEEKKEDFMTRVEPLTDCAERTGTTAEPLPGAVTAAERTPGEWFVTENRPNREYRLGARYTGVTEHYIGKVYSQQDAEFIVALVNAHAHKLDADRRSARAPREPQDEEIQEDHARVEPLKAGSDGQDLPRKSQRVVTTAAKRTE